ncbi:Gfo/Idh/MocA family protein [Numidum massiliense]|uniref:Gfo/Idh/MocA family protein n=1 Tax=Numidum massiliense TaxID=1522315 RepID=UPI0006D56FD0|nr:Gfo/Idh/MocA family oxidoreductase [Numidum massiliense]
MSTSINIGIIGCDTSHVPAFTQLLNDTSAAHHVPGGKVVAAFPGGSPDFALSYTRIEGIANKLREGYNVNIVDSPEAVAEQCDAILLESVDGRVHLEQFKRIAPYRKPVFIDKPFAVSSAEAKAIAREAYTYGIPIMSCSALRYSEGFTYALNDSGGSGDIIACDAYGPMEIEPTQPGLFWYGIHTVEMLYAALGKGCRQVTAVSNEDHDLVVGVWSDGRIGTIRGNRKGNMAFGALLHRERATSYVDVSADDKPFYASMLEHIITMFRTGEAPIDPAETLEIVRFIEAANESRKDGRVVYL